MSIDAQYLFGTWQDMLATHAADCLIVDAPYSERTHVAHSKGKALERAPLNYACWGAPDVQTFVESWAPRIRGWFVTITDHVLAPFWSAALEAHGRYVFSPLAYVAPGSRVRLQGDGPSQWSTWIIAARPRTRDFAKWGTLPGAYVLPAGQRIEEKVRAVMGGKPLWLMRSLVRDYSRVGDLIVDPCAGAATTLRAAQIEGRCSIGAEPDPKHFAIGEALLSKRYTPTLFLESPQLRTTLPMFEDSDDGTDRSSPRTSAAGT